MAATMLISASGRPQVERVLVMTAKPVGTHAWEKCRSRYNRCDTAIFTSETTSD